MHDLLQRLRPYTAALLVAALLLVASAALPGAAVLVLERALSAALEGREGQVLIGSALAFVGLYVAAGALQVARVMLTKGVAWRLAADLRARLHLAWLRGRPDQTGQRLAALTSEVDDVQYAVSAGVTALRNPLTLLVLVAASIALAPALVPWALLLLPAVALPARWGGSAVAQAARRSREARADLLQEAQEQLLGLRTLALSPTHDAEARFALRNEHDRAARLRLEILRILPAGATRGLAAGAVALLLWLGGQQVARGALQGSELVAFGVALGLMQRPLAGLTEVWTLLRRAAASLERVQQALDEAPAVPEAERPARLPEGRTLALEGVGVALGERFVLRGVDLVVEQGEWVALMGPSGAGKSTLLSLLWRWRDPDEGRITLDGVPLPDLGLGALRALVGVMEQEPFLFARSVRENLLLGSGQASDDALRAALRRAGAEITELDTPLSELGRSLSGGERQRLCLARTLLHDPDILLLDEATNQVDAETEALVLRAVRQRRPGQTVLWVTHKASVAAQADRVVHLRDGRLLQRLA